MIHVALITLPQKEAAACAVLGQRYGADCAYPVEQVIDRTRTRRAGQPVMRERRILPGYVFAAFRDLPPLHDLLSSRYVRDCIRTSRGDIALLHPDDLRRIYAMRHQVEAEARAKIHRAVIRPGDEAHLMGIFDGQPVEVIEIGAKGAKVRLRLYGREMLVPVEQLVKAAE